MNNVLVNDLESTEVTKFISFDASNLVVDLSVDVEKKVKRRHNEKLQERRKSTERKMHFRLI